MGASVRIEDEAFSDQRYVRLAQEAGLADADHARGKMAVIWRQCTIEQSHYLDVKDVTAILGERGPDALVNARLGERKGDRIRIKGTKGRIEWLKKLRGNGKFGKLGGRPKKNPQGFSNKPTRVCENARTETPPAPAPAPAPAQLLTPTTKTESSERSARSKPATALVVVEPVDAVVWMPLVDGSSFGVTQKQIDEWAPAYPAVDIATELHKARAWCDANPTRRKTKRGVHGFLVSWLARAQDSGRGARASPKQTPTSPDFMTFKDRAQLECAQHALSGAGGKPAF
jgi:hypothetical protein